MKTFLLSLSCACAIGCASTTTTPSPVVMPPVVVAPVAATLQLSSQHAFPNEPASVFALATTADGHPASNLPITWSSSSGRIFARLLTTDIGGQATAVITTDQRTVVTVSVGTITETVVVEVIPPGHTTPPVIEPPFVPPPIVPTLPTITLSVNCTGVGVVTCEILTVLDASLFPVDSLVASTDWAWGDGTIEHLGSLRNRTHTYAHPGSYAIGVVVTLSDGRRAQATGILVRG